MTGAVDAFERLPTVIAPIETNPAPPLITTGFVEVRRIFALVELSPFDVPLTARTVIAGRVTSLATVQEIELIFR
jgi:hypothetical protein